MHSEVVFEFFVFKFNDIFVQFFNVTKACLEIVLSSKEIIESLNLRLHKVFRPNLVYPDDVMPHWFTRLSFAYIFFVCANFVHIFCKYFAVFCNLSM